MKTMLEKFHELSKNDYVRLFNGDYRLVKNVVGFCKSRCHHGFISKGLAKKHECCKKACYHLVRYTHTYWDANTNITAMASKKAKKEMKQRERQAFIATLLTKFNPRVEVIDVKESHDPFELTIVYTLMDIYLKSDLNWDAVLRRMKQKYGCNIKIIKEKYFYNSIK